MFLEKLTSFIKRLLMSHFSNNLFENTKENGTKVWLIEKSPHNQSILFQKEIENAEVVGIFFFQGH